MSSLSHSDMETSGWRTYPWQSRFRDIFEEGAGSAVVKVDDVIYEKSVSETIWFRILSFYVTVFVPSAKTLDFH